MQTPPPVANLLLQLKTMACNVSQLKSGHSIDWDWRPGPEEWSLTEVLCHLRDVEAEVHQSRFKALLKEEGVFLPGVSADEWAGIRGYREQNGVQALEEYLVRRQETLDLLSGVSPDQWKRQGIHSYLGRTSLHELLSLITRHDELHWEQIKALLEGQNSTLMQGSGSPDSSQ